MKRIISVVLVLVMGLGVMACGANNNNNTEETQNSQVENGSRQESESESESEYVLLITSAKEILDAVWATYDEEERFVVVGGHYENFTDGSPAVYDMTKLEDLEASFCFPKENVTHIDDVATLQHGMIANNFSAAAYHVTEDANMQALMDDITNMTTNNQWLYGRPEKLVIITVGEDYFVTAFGSAEIVENFKNKLLSLYHETPVLRVDEEL